MKNPAALFKFKGLWDKFVQNHPKFPMFINALKNSGISEGSVLEIQVTQPDGQHMKTNIKVSQEDMELFEQLRELF